MLEKRHDKRRKEIRPVSLMRGGVEIVTGQMRDVSRSGCLVVVESNPGLNVGDSVRVEMMYAHGAWAKVMRISRARGGIGIALHFHSKLII